MKDIAVLMTVYNRKETTLNCLEHLFAQTGLDKSFSIDVFLVDDGSTDGTADAVKISFPEVRIIQGDGTLFWNRGMWTAWNFAVKEKDYDYYLWLNDDTALFYDSLLRLLEESSGFEDRNVIVGSTCKVGNRNIITYGGWNRKGLFTDLTVNHECDTINGNIVLIPRYSYNLLGFNDHRFRHSLGDMDYGLRAKEKDVPCITAIGLYGECDLHDQPTIWMNPTISIKERFRNFMSPLGNNPFEFFYFRRKHFGILPACITFASNWGHFLFPSLWPRCYKDYNYGK